MILLVLISLLIVTKPVASQLPALIPVMLQCEHLHNPMSIDVPRPRLSWQLQSNGNALCKAAYTLTVSTDSTGLVQNRQHQIQWQVQPQSFRQLVTYNGKALQPYTRYFWKVSVKDMKGHTATSTTASFEMGPMHVTDWQADWITDKKDITIKPAPYFRKRFTVSKTIVSARAYIAVAGLYELYINGQRIGDHILDPAYTRYDRRNLYVTYDVTKQLQEGKNAIGVLLGNGWYNMQSPAVWFFDKAPWRERPCFCMDLHITYSDRTIETISTNKSWKSALSPIVFNSIYTGEYQEANKTIPNWNTPAFDDNDWKAVVVTHSPSEQIAAQAMYPIRDCEKLKAVDMHKFSDTDYLFTIARNIAGTSEITLKGNPGTIIRLKHGERLDSAGHVDQSNIDCFLKSNDEPFQTDIYTLKGRGSVETFRPRFNYKGFRYVEVSSNKPVELNQSSLMAYFEHSDVPAAGMIKSSDTLINRIWQATNNSYLSNLFGYPTDCPQREKNGWTGDAHFAIETGLYNFDAITIYEKWLADNRDAQQPNGTLPAIIPTSDWGYDHHNTLDWESGIVLIPWELYQFYGDSKALQDNYAAMCRYIDHVTGKYPDQIVTEGLGDREAIGAHADVALTSTAYYYADVAILAKAARLLNHQADEQKYKTLAEKIKKAFNLKFYHDGIYGHGFETENSAALYWGLVPLDKKALVAAKLAENVGIDSVRLDVGVLGARTILNALSDNGYAKTAYKLATKRTFPSWGYWMTQGLTTLPESWDFHKAVSLNHIFLGGISAWFYQGLGGIFPDEKDPGFHHILLRPHIVSGLDSFQAEHEGPYGKIVSGWKTENGTITYFVTIPANSSAELKLEIHGKMVKRVKLQSGNYQFDYKIL